MTIHRLKYEDKFLFFFKGKYKTDLEEGSSPLPSLDGRIWEQKVTYKTSHYTAVSEFVQPQTLTLEEYDEDKHGEFYSACSKRTETHVEVMDFVEVDEPYYPCPQVSFPWSENTPAVFFKPEFLWHMFPCCMNTASYKGTLVAFAKSFSCDEVYDYEKSKISIHAPHGNMEIFLGNKLVGENLTELNEKAVAFLQREKDKIKAFLHQRPCPLCLGTGEIPENSDKSSLIKKAIDHAKNIRSLQYSKTKKEVQEVVISANILEKEIKKLGDV